MGWIEISNKLLGKDTRATSTPAQLLWLIYHTFLSQREMRKFSTLEIQRMSSSRWFLHTTLLILFLHWKEGLLFLSLHMCSLASKLINASRRFWQGGNIARTCCCFCLMIWRRSGSGCSHHISCGNVQTCCKVWCTQNCFKGSRENWGRTCTWKRVCGTSLKGWWEIGWRKTEAPTWNSAVHRQMWQATVTLKLGFQNLQEMYEAFKKKQLSC